MSDPTAVSGTRRFLQFDPGLRYLRGSVAAMIVVLLSFWSMVELAGFAPVDVDAIVLSVVVAAMMTRRDLGTGLRERAADLCVLALATVVAALIGMASHTVDLLGETLFVLALGGFVWVRRFGPRAARIGTIATLPFIATLVTPLPIPVDAGFSLWALVGVAVAFGWATLVQWVRERPRESSEGVAARPEARGSVRAEARSRTTTAAVTATKGHRRPAPSTRMAIQLVVALSAAFLVGHVLFPEHVVWPVITAFIVCAGNRGRGDVVYKGVLRTIGGLGGTIVATLVSGAALPGGPGALVLIFLVLTVALWLRPVSYAYWAACVTAVLALLYGYFGQTGPGVLESRLLGVLWGGALAIAASWFILPVKTTDVLRRRSGDAVRALAAFTAALQDGADRATVEERRHAASRAVERVSEVTPAIRALRRALSTLAKGRGVPIAIREWAGRRRIAAADLADLVIGASPELERVSAAIDGDGDEQAALQLLRQRMRAIKAALEEMRPAAG
ncbi:FUSC family protein [Herbiconiux sp. UC225_62]|uniref:FUSC family protein n=1 Tax=Herbiconiux sp. UC225_62 TaxID=3350168 RepID=UPI0036D3797D